jgi:hypothetical protein
MGQRLLAQVVQASVAGHAVVEVGGQRFQVATPVPLAAGQVLDVTVKGLAPLLELVASGPPVEFSPEAYALAAVLTARSEAAGRPAPSARELDLLRRLLAESPGGPGADGATRARIANALQPVDPRPGPGDLAEGLRHWLAQSGVALEARLSAALARGVDPKAAAEAVQDDVRVMLARVPEGALTPEGTEIRQRAADAAAVRQLDVAMHRVRDGEWRLDIPVLFGDAPTAAHLRIREDGEGRAGQPGRRGLAIELRVNHPDFGPIHASARWSPPDVQIRLAGSPEAVETLGKDVASLTASLRARGFREVAVNLDVALEAPAVEPDEPPTLPGGSILRARA